ncbi:MAG: hypothetical protein TEF_19435 [Rhizobiales bacterium NRL2]|nr:MAG: hypothetical protein TEF_19435 [Rhizobiales bacterium NRL2]
MRTLIIVMGLTALVSFGARAENLYFLLINQSSADIVEFHVSPPDASRWTDNLIPDGYVLPAGNEVEVAIEDGQDHCAYDIRAVFADGEVFEEYDTDLCELGQWTFTD